VYDQRPLPQGDTHPRPETASSFRRARRLYGKVMLRHPLTPCQQRLRAGTGVAACAATREDFMKSRQKTRTIWTLSALALALVASLATAQARDEYGEVSQTVARISFLSGEVSYLRGDDPDHWQPADRNVPMTLGDRIYTGSRSRIELQMQGGDTVRLGGRSDFAALNLTDDTQQLSLRSGVASVQIRRLSENEIFELDTPNSAVTFDRPGSYRVDVDDRGYTRVSVRRGSATVAAGGGQIPVEAGEAIDVEGLDTPRYDIVALARPDAWDQWVSQRDGRRTNARSYRYVSAEIVGADDLDEYCRWENGAG